MCGKHFKILFHLVLKKDSLNNALNLHFKDEEIKNQG